MEMGTGFRVGRDDVGAGRREGFEIGVDRLDHQVDVEGFLRVRAKLLDDHGADGDVGHEMPVHDVDMDHVGAGLVHGADLFAETGKVRRQN
jgi:hypothetical protein